MAGAARISLWGCRTAPFECLKVGKVETCFLDIPSGIWRTGKTVRDARTAVPVAVASLMHARSEALPMLRLDKDAVVCERVGFKDKHFGLVSDVLSEVVGMK